MIKKLFKKFVTNNHRFTIESPEYRKVYLLNSALAAFVVVCAYFTVANLVITRQYDIAIINLVGAIMAVITLLYFHVKENLTMSTHLAVVTHFITLAGYLLSKDIKEYSFCWFFTLPPVVFFLLGHKKGTFITLLFTLAITTGEILRHGKMDTAELSFDSFLNIFFSLLVVSLLVYNFEVSRKETAEFLEKRNIELLTVNKALEYNKNKLQLILDSAGEGICGINSDGIITFCNESAARLLNYKKPEDFIGINLHELVHNKTRNEKKITADECRIMQTLRTGKSINSHDEVFWRADGSFIEVQYTSAPLYKDGTITGSVITFMDITEQKEIERRIKYLSCFDSLTGLFNRGYFTSIAKEMDTENNLPIAVIYADIDGLKLTNDVFGHSAGDELIKTCADVLRKVCRERDILARVGGDEFIILMPDTDAQSAEGIVQEIKKELSAIKVISFKCSMAFGYDVKSKKNDFIERVMEIAEGEMYKDKSINHKKINDEIFQTIVDSLHTALPLEKEHSENVSLLCQEIGRVMRLPETDIKLLKDAGFYHDIGKVTLDFKILCKKSELIKEEKEEVHQHPAVGYRILSLFDETLDLSEYVYYHHERWDGSGYPKGLKGEEIPLISRIIAVAEAYDHNTGDRTTLKLSKSEALNEISSLAGTKYDPAVVEAFNIVLSDNPYINK